MMGDLFASGRIIDFLLVMVTLEAILIWTFHYRTGRGISLTWLLPNLAAGVCLLMALRAALADDPWEVPALWLAGALLAHLTDLASRWRH